MQEIHTTFQEGQMKAKVRTTITLDKELMDWVVENIKERRFASVSHAVEFSIQKQINREREDFNIGMINEEKPLVFTKKRNA
jgi:Arc/MetJ-type ribon-helix-helix transcriptional regulator